MDAVLDAFSDGAGVGAVVAGEGVGDVVAVENVMELGSVEAQAILSPTSIAMP